MGFTGRDLSIVLISQQNRFVVDIPSAETSVEQRKESAPVGLLGAKWLFLKRDLKNRNINVGFG